MKNIFFVFLLLCPCLVVAQVPDALEQLKEDSLSITSKTIFQYLQQDTILQMHFKTDLKKLNRYETKPEPHPAMLTLQNTTPGIKDQWKVKLEQRGKLRRRICYRKPLRIIFSKKELEKLNLSILNKLKLVTNCKGNQNGNQLVLKEYMAYRLYNILTEKSYRAQLVYTTFEDSLGTAKSYEAYGFLLEPSKEMGVRIGGTITEVMGMKPENMNEKDYLLMSVFQYFIANSDWKLSANHNVVFLKVPGQPLLTTIPYDFDFSGLVNAYYASVDPNLPIKDKTERLFMGSYKNPAVLEEVLQLFRDKKEEMKAFVLNFNYLSLKDRKYTWNYLEGFFREIKNKSAVSDLFPKETFYQDQINLDRIKVKK